MSRSLDTLYGNFKLIQDNRYFKLGTDSVILSDFCTLKKNRKVCDLGAGCGAITVLLAARDPHVRIDAVEIQEGAASILKENIAFNGLTDRVSVFTADLRNATDFLTPGSYDLVVTNPPYFTENSGYTAKQSEKAAARCDSLCSLDDLCLCASRLLKWGGLLSLVYRAERMPDLLSCMAKYHIEPKKLRLIQNNYKTPPRLVLVEGKLGAMPSLTILPTLLLRDLDGAFTRETLQIYHKDGES